MRVTGTGASGFIGYSRVHRVAAGDGQVGAPTRDVPRVDRCADGTRVLECEQWIPRPPAEVFPFFADAHNLERITPPFLHFRVVTVTPPAIGTIDQLGGVLRDGPRSRGLLSTNGQTLDGFNRSSVRPEEPLSFGGVSKGAVARAATVPIKEGTQIEYRLRLHGVPLRWRSRIESWQPGRQFVDRQLRGPYALWHHTHEFEAAAGGTLMRDRVRYAVPFGAVGELVAGRLVARDVAAIFAYRRRKIGEIFGGSER